MTKHFLKKWYVFMYSMWPKVLSHVKKIPIKSTKTIFFQKIIVKSFLDRFEQISHQNIQNCLYFDCLFADYVYMSDFYLYII